MSDPYAETDEWLTSSLPARPATRSPEQPEDGSTVTGDAEGAREARWVVALIEEGAGVDNSFHSWRCSYPDMYGPCDCVEESARSLMAVADEEQAALRAEVERLRRDVERYRPLWSDPLAQPNRWRDEPNPHPRGYLSTHEVLEDYDGAIRCASNWSTDQRHAALDRTMGHVRPLVYEVEHLRAALEGRARLETSETTSRKGPNPFLVAPVSSGEAGTGEAVRRAHWGKERTPAPAPVVAPSAEEPAEDGA